MDLWCHAICRPYTFLTKEKGVPNIYGIRIVGGKVTLIPVVNSSGMTSAKAHNRYMTYITTYPPRGTHVFDAARIILHTLRECIHILRMRPQDIPRSPCPRCTVVASRTIDTQLLPHARACPKANLILRGWVRDSHHLTGGYLPSYLVVDASLQESKLQKVKVESKSLLACHMLRIL
jgi:hypothetical protein